MTVRQISRGGGDRACGPCQASVEERYGLSKAEQTHLERRSRWVMLDFWTARRGGGGGIAAQRAGAIRIAPPGSAPRGGGRRPRAGVVPGRVVRPPRRCALAARRAADGG